jgi:hypothetical protein
MERRFECPSCGAGNVVTNPGVLMKICDFCKTAIYWDKSSALRAGNKSLDLPESPRFKVGATGKIKGRRFTVLGRLTYAHEHGTWNEWFIELGGGDIRWLAEDEGELFLEKPLQLASPVPAYADLLAGMQIKLNDRVGVIEELGQARCIGGEGQIPFVVEIGETYPYADGAAADGSFVFGLEYDAQSGAPTAFIGQVVSLEETKREAGPREEPVGRTAQVIRCTSCGKPYEGSLVETTEMIVCQACGTALKLDKAELVIVGKNKGKAPMFTLTVGTPITLEKISYEVMGRLYYVEYSEGRQYPSYEYVLYNPEKGYLWLSEENGHFTISRPFHLRVSVPVRKARRTVSVGQERFQFYEEGILTLRWVDGALPWTAEVGEKTQYLHVIKPPEYVDQETTRKEVEMFRGRYLSREELAAGLPKGTMLPVPSGVYSCQPYVPSDWLKGWAAIGLAFLVLNVFLLVYCAMKDRQTAVLQERVTSEQYSQEYLSKPFQVSNGGAVLHLAGSAPLNNSWLAVDFGLVDADDQVVKEFWNEASYYHGRDSEGAWSEGGTSFDAYFKVDNDGFYRLLVHATGGSDYQRPSRNEPLSLTLYKGATLPSYFAWPIILSGLVALLGPVYRMYFEARRWAPVMESGSGNGDDGGNGDD